jgi:hypothetical protein
MPDPSPHTPYSPTGVYPVPTERLMASILLGDSTYDAVLLVLDPPDGAAGQRPLERPLDPPPDSPQDRPQHPRGA